MSCPHQNPKNHHKLQEPKIKPSSASFFIFKAISTHKFLHSRIGKQGGNWKTDRPCNLPEQEPARCTTQPFFTKARANLNYRDIKTHQRKFPNKSSYTRFWLKIFFRFSDESTHKVTLNKTPGRARLLGVFEVSSTPEGIVSAEMLFYISLRRYFYHMTQGIPPPFER